MAGPDGKRTLSRAVRAYREVQRYDTDKKSPKRVPSVRLEDSEDVLGVRPCCCVSSNRKCPVLDEPGNANRNVKER